MILGLLNNSLKNKLQVLSVEGNFKLQCMDLGSLLHVLWRVSCVGGLNSTLLGKFQLD